MAPAITANSGHLAYHYCFDDADPDGISAFQLYVDADAAAAFLRADAYLAYEAEVGPLLAGSPEVRRFTPMWTKAAAA